jgi:Zn-dependent protease
MNEDNKFYPSFHDISPREYMYFPKGKLEGGKPGHFSRIELIHLTISIFILTIAFSFALSSNNLIFSLYYGFEFIRFQENIIKILFGIIIAFFIHEISHKIMAQKYGLWSEYRMYIKGLGLALLLGVLTPFVFAAPGAVMFRGKIRNFEMGHIALAGPLSNIIIATITLIIYIYIFIQDTFSNEIIGYICLINSVLATFNLLPIDPLDGSKIIKWNENIWILSITFSAFIMLVIISYIIF